MIVETRTFRLADGVSEADFLAADRDAQVAAYGMPGVVRRTTCWSDDGSWLVLTIWGDAAGDVPGLDGLVDPGSVEVRRYTTLD